MGSCTCTVYPLLEIGNAAFVECRSQVVSRPCSFLCHVQKVALPAFLWVDRVNPEIKVHPEALGVAEEEKWEDKRHWYADDQQQRDGLLGESKPGSNRYDYDRYQEFGDDKIDGDGAGPVARFALETPSTDGAFLVHSEAPAKEFAFATIGAA